MKRIVTTAFLVLLLAAGCNQQGGVREGNAQAATPQEMQAPETRGPYYAGLIEEYRTTLARDPRNLAALIALGNAYFDSGQWRDAVTIYEHALVVDPTNADVRTDLGTAYRNLGMPDRALAQYEHVLQMDPDHLNARYNMGIVYAYDKRNARAAIRAWEQFLKLAPNHPQAERIRADIAALRRGARLTKGNE